MEKGNPERIEDYLWFIFNHLINENAKQSVSLIDLYTRNDRIYREMISFRRRVEGKRVNELQKLYNQNKVNLDLESGLSLGFEMEFVIIGVNDCEESKKISCKHITVEQALQNNIIPYENCTRRQGCACLMSLIPKRDANGNLIIKSDD